MSTTTEQMARPLLSVEEARARMLEGLQPLPAEDVALDDALGRVLATEAMSLTTLPPWDNSAMDGFAVIAADLAGASDSTPVELSVTGEVAAGAAPSVSVAPGTALRILTGAPLPPGADSVVPVEDTDAEPGVAALPAKVRIRAEFTTGAHIRRAGSDLRAGQRLLEPGAQLTPAAIAVAAAGGHATLPVYGRPRVAILATGDELVAAGAAARPCPDPGQQHARADGRGARCRRGSSLVGHRARQPRIGQGRAAQRPRVGGHHRRQWGRVRRCPRRGQGRLCGRRADRPVAHRRPARQAVWRSVGRARRCSSACPATRSAAWSRSSSSCGP